ncbi:hypothetical protein B4127_1505 [Bacillus pumilus]|uniref:Phage protein n=1 Tax=Bacillus pumilus TaxID=1408 RepID=A0AB34QQ53_BACPU|nr:hypothetical protein [Bacillus pumilus]KIL12174.1 hypothetical protein B4127_1505 [Bacillus pumilus]
MTEQTLRIKDYYFRIIEGVNTETWELTGKEADGYFKADLIKKNIAQVGSKKIDFSNEIKVDFNVFGEETKKQINEHLMAVYKLVVEGAKEYGLEED